MMNRTKRFSVIAAALAASCLLAAALLLASCGNLLNPAGKAQDGATAPGAGTVRVLINGEDSPARTIFPGELISGDPAYLQRTGLHYEYVFDADGSGADVTVRPATTGPQANFVLPIGGYTLTVKAYAAANYAVNPKWISDSTPTVTVSYGAAGAGATVSVDLIPYDDGGLGSGKGRFIYAIAYPDTGVTLDTLTWTRLDVSEAAVDLLTDNAGEHIDADSPYLGWVSDTAVSHGIKSQVAPGSYLVQAHLTETASSKTAGREVVVRVYAGLDTFIDPTAYSSPGNAPGFLFTAADFSTP
jgi:hypothetical protein